MSESIKVYPEILKVHLAYDDGWKEVVGHKVTVQEIEFSFVVKSQPVPVVMVSSLEGGVGITTIPFSPLLLFIDTNKQRTLQMLKEKAELVSRIIDKNGKDTVIKLIEKHKQSYEDKFGKMPLIELYDMSDVSEEVREVLK